MDIANGTYFEDYEKNNRIEFEKIELKESVSKIYYSAIEKAFIDYAEEIEQKRTHFLEVSYTKEQAQERFNEFTNDILYKNENDNCVYRVLKNEVLKIYSNTSTKDLQTIIIDSLVNYINNGLNSFNEKLTFLNQLPEQIYNSNKIHRQFLFFKDLAEKQMNNSSNKIEEIKKKHYLKDLFIDDEKYTEIINILTKENMLSEIDDFTFNWYGNPKEPSLSTLKLLGTLAYDLKCKKYYNSNISKKQIAEAFTNAFPNSTLSNVYYGRIESELSEANDDSKAHDYLYNFHFIKCL